MSTAPTPADVARAHKRAQTPATPTANSDDATRQQIAALETQLAQARRDALISQLITDYSLTRDDAILLTGQDETTLIAQAQRLQTFPGEQPRRGPVAPKEGQPVRRVDSDDTKRSFLAEIGVSDEY